MSILPVLSKILERVVNSQLTDFLEKNGILLSNQSGFRGKFSTDTCTIDLTDYVKSEISSGKMVGMTLIDLCKAFDTVNHDILIEKLAAIGVSSIEWFKSYLAARSQCVVSSNSQSDFEDISCGVPQGSILGPQLFLIYINDMVVSTTDCKLSLYADDSALIFSHTDPAVIASTLSRELSECKRWLVDNKLSLHVGKTECILFGSPRRLKKVSGFSVSCDGQLVNRVRSVKYLGLLLDENMSGLSHAIDVIKKCAGRISFLYRHADVLNFKCRKLVCSALIMPYMNYCSSSWYTGLSAKLRGKLDVLQRRMVRFVFSLAPRSHVGTEKLRELCWLSVKDTVRFFKLQHVFKIRFGLAPDYLTTGFQPITSSHSHLTRGSGFNFRVSRDLARCQSNFAYTAITDWNSLPTHLKKCECLPSFRSRLKKHLISFY